MMKAIWRTLISFAFVLCVFLLPIMVFFGTFELLKSCIDSGRFPQLLSLMRFFGPYITFALLALPALGVLVGIIWLGARYFRKLEAKEDLEPSQPLSMAHPKFQIGSHDAGASSISKQPQILGYQHEKLNRLSTVISSDTVIEKDKERDSYRSRLKLNDYLWKPDQSYFRFQLYYWLYVLVVPVGLPIVILLSKRFTGDLLAALLVFFIFLIGWVGGDSWVKHKKSRSADSLVIETQTDDEFVLKNTSKSCREVALGVRYALAKMYCLHPQQIHHGMSAHEFCYLYRGRPLLAEFAFQLEMELKIRIDLFSFINFMRECPRENVENLLKDVQLFVGKTTVISET